MDRARVGATNDTTVVVGRAGDIPVAAEALVGARPIADHPGPLVGEHVRVSGQRFLVLYPDTALGSATLQAAFESRRVVPFPCRSGSGLPSAHWPEVQGFPGIRQ